MIGTRIAEMRKHFKMTQKAFGETLGASRDVMANIENNRVEPNATFIGLLCTKYNVDEHWLRTGEGEPFAEPDTFSLDEYALQNNLSGLEIDIIKSYMELDPSVRQAALAFLQNVFGKHPPVGGDTDPEISAEVEAYREQLLLEKASGGKSSATREAGYKEA